MAQYLICYDIHNRQNRDISALDDFLNANHCRRLNETACRILSSLTTEQICNKLKTLLTNKEDRFSVANANELYVYNAIEN